eukprot:3978345-Pleurochrysis_carterae.AAC.1
MVGANGMPRKVLRFMRPRGGEGGFQTLAWSECACGLGMFARATLCCAGAQPALCGIAELKYGNPLDLRVIITHI